MITCAIYAHWSRYDIVEIVQSISQTLARNLVYAAKEIAPAEI